MTAYVDTSALVAVYVPERHSPAARRAVAMHPSIPFTLFHRLEARNAFELLVGRRQMTAQQRDAVLAHLADDVAAGRLVETAVDYDAAIRRAMDLSIAYSRRHLTRSLDLIHVAVAEGLGCTTFVSGDRRQLRVARALKLRTIDTTAAMTRPRV
jgi:predicted nucleic acid-binding protein